jgi:site-specific DNA recombinase
MSTLAAAYMRCSGKASLFGDTWERQITAIKECCTKLGLTLLQDLEFREEAVPGKTDEEHRPAFQEMISTLLANGCRTIIVESLDRLAREYRIQEQLIIYIASKELTLISANTGENITEAMLADPMRRALVQIQGVISELDKNMIVAKLRKARERKRSAGTRCEGRKPFGEDPDRPDEVPVLALMKQRAAQGWTPDFIAMRFNETKVPTRLERYWHGATISKILSRHSGFQNPSEQEHANV